LNDLSQLAPATAVVNGVEVRGLSFRDLKALMDRFPNLTGMFFDPAVTVADAVVDFPDISAAIVAAGLGKRGDESTEAAFHDLPIETQFDFVEKVYALSAPQGFPLYWARITKLWTSGSFAPRGLTNGAKNAQRPSD